MSGEPGWVAHAVWWHVYPLGFAGADTRGADREPAHRLPLLENWLDYAVRLGASGLALGPIFDSSTHGYDTIDHRRIDPRLGDDDDFDHLVRAAHDRGLRVMLDGVFNHVGLAFPRFQRALEGGPEAAWFHLTWAGGGEPSHETFEGHRDLVKLNHANPDVAAYVADVMTHWLDRGADAWRLDAAYAVPREFWAEVLPRVRRAHPSAYFAGEVIHGDYDTIVRETGMDSVTQYELWKAIWSSLNDGNLFELAWAFKRHNGYLDTFAPLTFVGNHDVTRLASRIEDERHLSHALVTLLTVGGTPSIYYGDEHAFRGVKEDRAGGDDAVRPAFPASPEDLAPYGRPVYRLHQDLIGLRRRHPWLHRGRTDVIDIANGHLVYATTDGRNRLTVALNLGDADLPLPPGGTIVLGSHPQATGTVPAHGWTITA
ncbi:alpha-amylase family glycosyl hydrolase [Actinomadura sp. DC4]|uniref:alpha-amylase family glycosyl hydrolase n=1 Tax=Actinomadura sp. DC4 TaxID=3055069 RepID=UPI0025B16810|nr:alpha-amylase family glycosyl hydrolase [Actinomadura sp. DC4]MDN3354393.1 alpha-amylase family glycosyl hydrolase [Actinomadura sp. DC4]